MPKSTPSLTRLLSLIFLVSIPSSLGAMALQPQNPCATTDRQGPVQLKRATSGLSLCEGHAVHDPASSGMQKGKPLALASADFDEDGVPDLVTAFGTTSKGTLTVYRGNIAALWPYGAALVNGPPAAFLPNARSFSIAESPDLMVTGDFDLDGHVDIVTAHRGSSALYFLKGDGHGGFAAAKRFEAGGRITDLIAGEFNQPDGVADLVVGITGAGGDAALVFSSSNGGLKGQPKTFALPHPATTLALGRFNGTGLFDLAVGGGSGLSVIHGRYIHDLDETPAVVTHQTLPFTIRAITAGEFTNTAPSLAVLGDDDKVHVLTHALSEEALASASSRATATMSAVAKGNVLAPMGLGAEASAAASERAAAMRQAPLSVDAGEWTEHVAVTMPGGFSQRTPRLVAARVSGSPLEDLLAVDSSNQQIHMLSAGRSTVILDGPQPMRSKVDGRSLRVQGTVSATSEPVAVLPMRLSQHGLSGLVALVSGSDAPVIAPQDSSGAQTFTVTNTSDITDPSQKDNPPAGSLRAAMLAAQRQTSINIAGGSTAIASVVFNIPTTDPGYNATTGIFTIKPISEAAGGGGSYQDPNALPPIYTAITIDGYTQPGASPNTLAAGDNAKILIQIDGSKATVLGASGIRPFDDSGSVIRGLALTGWKNPIISSANVATGGWGIEASGVQDFFEGNFIGTADGKTAASNLDGVFVDNGPAFGNTASGNIVGGTTPQARNVISGNSRSGIILYYTGTQAQVQGNFIGLDATGAAVLPNGVTGITGIQPTDTVGGTQAGARNYFAGNPNNIDINDIAASRAETGGLVVGNYIGTDVTGTKGLSPNSDGVGIQIGPSNYVIGGTSPAARNIISGNVYGIFIGQSTFYNVVQGNYIGTDPTGTIAVPNLSGGIGIGFSSNYSGLSPTAAGYTTIGGTSPGAGNVIAGNIGDGVDIYGTSQSSGYTPYIGNTIQGNFIGVDATGTKALPNTGNGISLTSGATNNVIGGTVGGAANIISNNGKHGVMIDPASGSTTGPGSGNSTTSNVIRANGGAGVRIVSGNGNRISQNSIFGNGALGIDIATAGVGTNSHCNATNSGANMLQNYPVLTPGTGSVFISATATDPSGNTSEFSKAVQATSTGSLLSLIGNFDAAVNTKFTIEFFSNAAADASGYGQGQTYLGSTTVTTDATCATTITDPVDTTKADVSVVLTKNGASLTVGPDFGGIQYYAAVANNGPATAHNVVLTDTLPAQLQVSSTYCNVGTCQSPITTTQGTCTVSGKTITCNLGTLAPGASANIMIPVQVIATGSLTHTVTVAATEADPNPANNTSSLSGNGSNPYPYIDHLSTTGVLVNSAAFPLNIYGTGLVPSTTVTFNGTSLPVTGVVDNQNCPSSYGAAFCTALQVQVPASLLTTAGSYVVEASSPEGNVYDANFLVASACAYTVQAYLTGLDYEGTDLISKSAYVATNVPSCTWTSSSSLPWATILDGNLITGSGSVDIAIAPNTTTSARSGTITVAGQSVSVSQDAGSASVCTEVLTPGSATIAAAGSTGTFTASVTPTGCYPFVEPYPQNSSTRQDVQWITTGSDNLISGSTITYTVATNTGPARTGSVTVGGTAFVITQAAPACVFTLTPPSAIAAAAGSTGSFSVTPTPASCAWTATPSSSQVSITAGSSGTGNGTVSYKVAANTGAAQTPTISVGNATTMSVFTISQASANTCTFTLSPSSKSVSSEGGSGFFTVTASFPFCRWTAASNNPDSLALVQGFSGTGNGFVLYVVGQNSGSARTLTITAGCQTFTINQGSPAVASAPAPTITSLQPATAAAGSAAFTLTVNGTNFLSGAVVNFNGVARATTFVSTTQLTASILASDLVNSGTFPVTVTNPAGGGGTSNAVSFTVTSIATNPVPVLTQLQPSTVAAGSSAFSLTVTGTGFVSGTTMSVNGSPRATTFVSATQLTAAITAADIATPANLQITATTPTPGGGTSNALVLTVTAASNPVPVLTQLQPGSVTAGSGAFTLTLNGTGFVTGATVNVNGSPRTTTFVSATQLTAAITAADVATPASLQITATNPTPGGGVSNALALTVAAPSNPVPTITTLQPASVTAGAAGFTLTISGTNFLSTSAVSLNGSARATTFVSATALTVSVTAADVANPGSLSITVSNPSPGGGVSNTATLTITATAGFTLSSPTGARTIAAGASTTFSIVATAQNGTYATPIALSISGLPAGATAVFSPASLTPGSTSATSVLTITAPATRASLQGRPLNWPLYAMAVPLLGGLLLRRRAFRRPALMLMALAVLAGSLSGCGAGFLYPGTTQTYTLTVTGTAGATQQTTTLQLTVNF